MTSPESDSSPPPSVGSRPLRCAEVMKRAVQFVREHDSLFRVAQLMREQDVGFLPVCDRDSNKVIGIITDRDIVTRACGENLNLGQTTVKSVMTDALVACRPDDPISRVELLMREHRITRIVITDAEGVLVGVVSLSDLAQYESAARIGRTLQNITQRKYAPERP